MRRARHAALAAALSAALLATQPAQACGFHGYVPQETTVEKMLGSQLIVLARPAANNPFRFDVTQVLRGDGPGTAVPFLVDSVTRRRLAADTQAAVLLGLDYDGNWQRLAFVDARYRVVLQEILVRLQVWEFGGDQDRFQYFADRLNDPDPAIAALALSELDVAPYDVLDQLALTINVSAILDRFFAPERAGTIPVRAILLGQSGDARALEFIRARYENGRAPKGPMAGAFALAWIELEGAPAVARLVALLAAGDPVDTVTRDTMLDALAIHARTGGANLRGAILEQVAGLLEADKGMAAPVARQFAGRGVWGLTGPLQTALDAGGAASPAERYEVKSYLELAATQ